MRLIDLTDIGSPGMLVAYGVGRIGCQLSGDGDWGGVNNSKKPVAWLPDWMWSFKFPHNVINQGEYIKGCGGKFCAILIEPVYPTSFYESVIIFCCFFIVWIFRRKIKIPGAMFCLYLLIVGTERFLIEEIRVNYKYHFLNFSLSEAQIISLLFLISGLVGFCILRASKLKYYHPTSK